MKATLFLVFLLAVSLAFAVGRLLVPTTPLTLLGAFKDFAHLWVGFLVGVWLMGMRWLPTGYRPPYQPDQPREGIAVLCMVLAFTLSLAVELPATLVGLMR